MELIKVENRDGKQVVSAREVYEFLEVGTHFSTWFTRIAEKYDFIENIDFSVLKSGNPNGGIEKIEDYIVILDVAKELAMVSNTPKGKEARQYFIKCEQAWNSPEMIMMRAMQIANTKMLEYEANIKELSQKVVEYKPKADYFDSILQPDHVFPITFIAKDLGISANKLNKVLVDFGIQYDTKNKLMPWCLRANFDWMIPQNCDYVDYKNEYMKTSAKHLKWSEKGRAWLISFLDEKGYIEWYDGKPRFQDRKVG